MIFLYTAYVATWAIHITYVIAIVSRYRRLKTEIEELKKGK
jgi:hypothetical protein